MKKSTNPGSKNLPWFDYSHFVIAKTFILLFLVSGTGCSVDTTEKHKQEIMAADRAFSAYSFQHGSTAAFLYFAAEDVVLLKPNMHPIVGHAKLQDHYRNRSDTTYVLTWEPVYAKMAASGELGYTYGLWNLVLKNEPERVLKGTYATIWQLQKDGTWKFTLDTGNEGLGE